MTTGLAVADFDLWDRIGRFLYLGLIAYAVVLACTALRDAAASRVTRASYSFRRRSGGLFHKFLLLRFRVAEFYRTSKYFYYAAVTRFMLNVAVCVIYVTGTYRRSVFPALRILNIVFGSVLCGELAAQLVVSESAFLCALTLNVAFQVVSAPSLFTASGPSDFLNFAFLRAYCAYHSYRAVDQRVAIRWSSGKSFVVRLFAKSVTLTYLLAACIQLLEIPGDVLSDAFQNIWSPLGDWHFLNAYYYVIVTLSTVGYGDFSPITLPGRVFAVCMIIVGIFVFTDLVSNIVDFARRKPGSGTFVKRPNSRHIIVSGNPRLSDLVRFTSEFFAVGRLSNAHAKIVVLVESPTWSPSEWATDLARNEFLRARVEYLVGNVRDADALSRARIESADAMFLLSSPAEGVDPTSTDVKVITDILAIRNVRTDIPIYVTVLLKRSLVQSSIAQSTSSSPNDASLLLRKDMHTHAQYHGLRRDMLESEIHSLPLDIQHSVILDSVKIFENEKKQHRRVLLAGVPHIVKQEGPVHLALPGKRSGEHDISLSKFEDIASPLALRNAGDISRNVPVRRGGEENEFGDMPFQVQSQTGEDDLKRSTSVCLQDVNAALLAAHVKANGVGTLITNMVLDIQPMSTPEDPPWLAEYSMGAICALVHMVIPPQLHGVRVDDVAVLLYDHGLILMTTSSDQSGSCRELVLSPTSKLQQGDIGMFLTYHQPQYAFSALMLAALEFQLDENEIGEGHGGDLPSARSRSDSRRRDMANDRSVCQDESVGETRFADESRSGSTTARLTRTPSYGRARNLLATHRRSRSFEDRSTSGEGHGTNSRLNSRSSTAATAQSSSAERSHPHAQKSARQSQKDVSSSSPPALPRNDAISAAGDALNESDDGTDSEGQKSSGTSSASRSGVVSIDVARPRQVTRRRDDDQLSLVKSGDGYMPENLSRHIIISAESRGGLKNLPLLIQYIWRPLGRKPNKKHRKCRRIPIVVICSDLPSKFRDSYSKYDGTSLFFVEDCPSARATWRRSKLYAAKGVIMLADFGVSWQESDARTVFTIMTLDTFIKPDRDVFVAAELVEEKSLEFLREPQSARRVGVDHGDAGEVSSTDSRHESPESGDVRPHLQDLLNRDRAVAVPHLKSWREIEPTERHENPETTVRLVLSRAVSRITNLKQRLLHLRDASDLSASNKGGLGAEGTQATNDVSENARSGDDVLPGAEDLAGGLGGGVYSDTSRARRGVLLSRSRYASGDLQLPSAHLTLLVREYLEPGFVRFYTDLLGAGSNTESQKIRLVSAPPALFDSGQSVSTIGEKRVITYRELFVRMMRLGATPLGLYRSGAAPVRVPVAGRSSRGPQVESNCKRFAKKQARMGRSENDDRESGGHLWNIMRRSERTATEDVLPVALKHRGGTTTCRQSPARNSKGSEVQAPGSNADHGSAPRSEEANFSDICPHANGQNLNEAGAQPTSGKPRDNNLIGSFVAWATSSRSSKRRGENSAQAFDAYKEIAEARNKLPYVLTMPEPYTLVSERDGLYVLCGNDFVLPSSWSEGFDQALFHKE